METINLPDDLSKLLPIVLQGDPGGRPRTANPHCCTVEGCANRAYKDNPSCPLHTMRATRHGDPSVVLKRGRKVKT